MTAPLLIALGTRPEFVKMRPLINQLRARGVRLHIVVTGQHWDDTMCGQFLDGIEPDERWTLGHENRLAEMTTLASRSVEAVRPLATLVLGDTDTVPVFALASRRARIPVIHVEAGLRSFNPQSIEEVNRKVATALASLHFAPTQDAATFLLAEGVDPDRIHVVGNTAIDSLVASGLSAVAPNERVGVLVTAHRPTNVDGDSLTDLVASIIAVHLEVGPATFPAHPRTMARLRETSLLHELESAGVKVTAPVGHDELLEMLRASQLVVTDSGGLQEEAAYFGVPAVVLRRSTPRWEGIRHNIATLSRLEPDAVVAAARQLIEQRSGNSYRDGTTIYGDGHAASLIADVLTSADCARWLTIEEPDFTDGGLPRVISGTVLDR